MGEKRKALASDHPVGRLAEIRAAKSALIRIEDSLGK